VSPDPAFVREVLGRLLDPSELMLSRCGFVAVRYIPPGRSIYASVKDSCGVVRAGDAAREILFEAAHVLAEECGVNIETRLT